MHIYTNLFIGFGAAPTSKLCSQQNRIFYLSDSQLFESKRGDIMVRVSWDVKGQYPRRVETNDARGQVRREIRLGRINAPNPLP